MNKTIKILILILIITYAVLAILGSRGEYAAEKLLYRAIKTNAQIAKNPDVVPPKLLEYIENNLKRILEKYPKTETAKTANMTLAQFYIYNKRYDDAQARLDTIIKAYDKNAGILSMAHFLKGLTYEKQDKWPKALKEYGIVRDDYTATEIGIQIPLYIAKYYSVKGDNAGAKQAYNDAVLFYEKLDKDNSTSMLGYVASTLLLQTYLNMESYEQAGTLLADIILRKYTRSDVLVQLFPQIENIYVKKLNKPEKAIEIYKEIKEKTKDKKLIDFLDSRIKLLEKPTK